MSDLPITDRYLLAEAPHDALQGPLRQQRGPAARAVPTRLPGRLLVQEDNERDRSPVQHLRNTGDDAFISIR